MKTAPAVVRVEHVSKRFRSYDGLKGLHSLKTAILSVLRGEDNASPAEQVLEDVNLEVRRGDCLAILGRNGSGKSTLLKLIAGIYRPDTGRVMTRGRVVSLLELGTGFHPDFTGTENVFVNASILGLSQQTIHELLPQIVEFSGLGDRIDNAIRTYSAGMYVRLAFSVAIHMMPEIILVDEVLAVGDQDFRARCLEKIAELRASDTTILFVSHDLPLVRALASRAVVISGCRAHELPTVEEAIEVYAEPFAHRERSLLS